jgi:hypothetical protein
MIKHFFSPQEYLKENELLFVRDGDLSRDRYEMDLTYASSEREKKCHVVAV